MRNNPLVFRDPTGLVLETGWDVASLAMGVASLADNVATGNVGGAILDGVGIVADAAAVITPFVPGGAGAAIKAGRLAFKAGSWGDRAYDAIRAGDKLLPQMSNALRANARSALIKNGGNIAKAIGKYGNKLEVHHDIPLEWAKVMGPDFDPNDFGNLSGMLKGDHKEVTNLWRQFKAQNENPSAEQIRNFAKGISEEFGSKMIKEK